MRTLIVGGSGFLGTELLRRATALGDETSATFLTRHADVPDVDWHPLDLRCHDDVSALVGALKPAAIINTASRKSDWTITADGAVSVAKAAAEAGARLVHVSSDAVFSGSTRAYDETCVPDPTTPYGAAKAAAETAIRMLYPGAAIARTSLIVGDGGSVHEIQVRELAARRRDGMLFTDDVRCPVHVTDLAAALLELADSGIDGVCHVAGSDAVSRYELGVLVAGRDGLDVSALQHGPRPLGPSEVRLDSTATQRLLRTELRGVRAFLRPRAAGSQGPAAQE